MDPKSSATSLQLLLLPLVLTSTLQKKNAKPFQKQDIQTSSFYITIQNLTLMVSCRFPSLILFSAGEAENIHAPPPLSPGLSIGSWSMAGVISDPSVFVWSCFSSAMTWHTIEGESSNSNWYRKYIFHEHTSILSCFL